MALLSCSPALRRAAVCTCFQSGLPNGFDSLYGNHPELFQAVKAIKPLILLEITGYPPTEPVGTESTEWEGLSGHCAVPAHIRT